MAKYRSPFLEKAEQTTPFKKPGGWRAGYHTGEDWVCSNRKILSPADGVVSYTAYDADGYGNYIIIHTDDRWSILMAHFAAKPLVKAGDRVKAGQHIAQMGTTGNSTGVHLHIEIENAAEWNYGENLVKPSDYIDFNSGGSEGDDDLGVKQLCAILRYKGIYKGKDTEIIKAVQRKAKLTVDGIAGEKTVAQMYKDIHDFDTALQKRINKTKTAAKAI